MRFLLFFSLCCFGVTVVCAQSLTLNMSRRVVYVGEPITFTIACNDEELTSATLEVAPHLSIQQRGVQRNVTIVNNQMTSTSTVMLMATPMVPGQYTIHSATATLATGQQTTTPLNATFEVVTPVQDKDVQWHVSVSPQRIYVNDHYFVTYELRVPAISLDGRWGKPFLTRDFFGQLELADPKVSIHLPEGVNGIDETNDFRIDGTTCVYTWTVEIAADNAGKITFDPPLLPRQSRITKLEYNRNPETTETYAIGETFEVEVLAPPAAHCPADWTGIIGSQFSIQAYASPLNISVGDPLTLTLEIQTDGRLNMFTDPALPKMDGFQCLGDPKVTLDDTHSIARIEYRLRPEVDGLLEIPALTRSYFNREKETYETKSTFPIPIRVKPLSQLYYTFGDARGLQLNKDIPPPIPLFISSSPQPKQFLTPWMGWVFLGSLCFVLLTSCHSLLRFVLRIVLRPLYWLMPKIQLKIALMFARTPDEALIAIRQWTKRPALTPEEVERCSPPSIARDVANAMRELEAAQYAPDAKAWGAAVKTLRRTVTKLKFVLVLMISSFGISLFAQTEQYQWEHAKVISTGAQETADFHTATNDWLSLIAQGDRSRHTLLNGASSAFLAAQPDLAQSLVRHCEELHGRDADTKTMTNAIRVYQGHTPNAWMDRLLALHLCFTYGVKWDLVAWVFIAFLLTFAFYKQQKPYRRYLRCIRVVLFILLFFTVMSLWWSYYWRATHPLPNALPEQQASSESQATEHVQ